MNKLKELLSGKKSVQFLVGFCVLYLVILVLIWFINISPMASKTASMQQDILLKKEEMKTYDLKLEKRNKEIEIVRNTLNTKMGLFHNDQQIEKFYEEISNIAIRNKLTMKSLARGDTENLDGSAVNPKNDQNTSVMLQYLKVGVFYEIEGKFSNYLLMRKSLAEIEKIIIFEEESIERSRENKKTINARAAIFLPMVLFKREQ